MEHERMVKTMERENTAGAALDAADNRRIGKTMYPS